MTEGLWYVFYVNRETRRIEGSCGPYEDEQWATFCFEIHKRLQEDYPDSPYLIMQNCDVVLAIIDVPSGVKI